MNAEGETVRLAVDDVEPGDTIEYELVYENIGDSELSGLVVSAPVPASMNFVEGSESAEVAAFFEVSADVGATWGSPPLLVESDEGEVELPASEYRLVRWSPEGAIAPGETWTFSYSAAVEWAGPTIQFRDGARRHPRPFLCAEGQSI